MRSSKERPGLLQILASCSLNAACVLRIGNRKPKHSDGEDTHHLFLVARCGRSVGYSPLLSIYHSVASSRSVAVRVSGPRDAVGPSPRRASGGSDPHPCVSVFGLLVFLGRTGSSLHFEPGLAGDCYCRVLGGRSGVARSPSHRTETTCTQSCLADASPETPSLAGKVGRLLGRWSCCQWPSRRRSVR